MVRIHSVKVSQASKVLANNFGSNNREVNKVASVIFSKNSRKCSAERANNADNLFKPKDRTLF